MRTLFLVMAAMLMTLFSGCSSVRTKSTTELVADAESDIHSGQGQRVTGYVDATGAHHPFDGYVRLVPPDQLAFSPVPKQ
jgi:uncharacterized protein YceK